jgi:16S rRNA (cytidine1402-2'-O)-methyltransferase
MAGTLYIVATPIGNLEDITFRAVRILKEADLILCEDTRTTKKLLDRYEIKNKTISYHSHSKLSREKEIIERLLKGENLALVSDAGTPGISDPGAILVHHIREGHPDIPIVPVPGASAFISALSVSGLDTSSFIFLGFLPHKKGRETLFKEIADSKRTMVFYESTHRIMKTLTALEKYLGPERKIVIGRELTKKFEEIVSGTALELQEYFKKEAQKMKGEFVVLVESI